MRSPIPRTANVRAGVKPEQFQCFHGKARPKAFCLRRLPTWFANTRVRQALPAALLRGKNVARGVAGDAVRATKQTRFTSSDGDETDLPPTSFSQRSLGRGLDCGSSRLPPLGLARREVGSARAAAQRTLQATRASMTFNKPSKSSTCTQWPAGSTSTVMRPSDCASRACALARSRSSYTVERSPMIR